MDKQLIDAIAQSGIPVEDAQDMTERVFAAILSLLNAERTVHIDGVGRLVARAKVVKAGYPPAHVRRERKVALLHGVKIEQGEPYPDPLAKPVKRSTYGRNC